MKLILKIKLLPTPDQEKLLIETMKEANSVCDTISQMAWDKSVFNTFKLHHLVYYTIKANSKLASQCIIRCIAKVADSYKIKNKTTKRLFKPLGSISYDSNILSYKPNNIVSIWAINGRIKIAYVCYNSKYTPYIKGEADLVYKKGKFYLYQTVNIPNAEVQSIDRFIGVDFGQTDIAVLSDGTTYKSEQIKKVKKHYSKVKASVQSKGTKGCKKLLKRLSGRERRFVTISNHTISKQIVTKAKQQGKGIALEDLTNIRKNAKPKSKTLRKSLHSWSFFQLRQFITYKCVLTGVHLVVVPPAYTSQTCSECYHIGTKANPFRKGKVFACQHCGNVCDADLNASINIAARGITVTMPEKSTMFCTLHR